MPREPRRPAANADLDAPASVQAVRSSQEPVIEDRGSFSHGVCRVCGWAGPGRRSRQVARADATQHATGADHGDED